jgi:hypothetical protein
MGHALFSMRNQRSILLPATKELMIGNRLSWLRQTFRQKTTRYGLFSPQAPLPIRASLLPPVGFFANLKIRIHTERDVIYQSTVRPQSLALALDKGNVRVVFFLSYIDDL